MRNWRQVLRGFQHSVLAIGTITICAAGNGSAEAASGELHPEFDEEVREVLDLAREDEWSRAQELAEKLREENPGDLRLRRLDGWVRRERTRQADRRFERELGEIEERDRRFSPTLRDVFFDGTPRRLPMRPDVREAIEREEERQLIPETYGRYDVRPERSAPSNHLLRSLNQRLDLELEEVPIREVLLQVRRQTGINLAMAGDLPALEEPVTLHLKGVRVRSILDYLEHNYPVRFVLRENMVWVSPP